MTKLRYWLIKKLAGRDIIVINAKIEGEIKQKFDGQSGYVANDEIIYPEMSLKQYKLESERQRLVAKLKEEKRLLGPFPIILKERLNVIKQRLDVINKQL